MVLQTDAHRWCHPIGSIVLSYCVEIKYLRDLYSAFSFEPAASLQSCERQHPLLEAEAGSSWPRLSHGSLGRSVRGQV